MSTRKIALAAALMFFTIVAPLAAQTQILSQRQLQRIRDHLPRLANPEFQKIFDDPTTFWYDRESMGVAYQIGAGTSAEFNPIGFANAMRNISGDFPESRKPDGFGGNPNALSHFPWMPLPGGTHRSTNVEHFKLMWLPKREDGRPWPVVWYRHRLEGLFNPNRTVLGYNWTFPVGTVFGEVITVDFNRQHYVSEVRFRIREFDQWGVDIFRPFPTAEEFADAIQRVRPGWQQDAALANLVRHCRSKQTASFAVLRDNALGNRRFNTARSSEFNVRAAVDELPAADTQLIARLLDTTVFRSCLGERWKGSTAAPTTSASFHIVPQHSDLAFLGNTRESCARCHKSALDSARRPGNRLLTASGRSVPAGIYGWVRGNSGGILSWHPIGNLPRRSNRPVRPRMRQAFVTAGMLEPFNAARHPKSRYNLLRGPLNEKTQVR